MRLLENIADLAEEATTWRHDIHRHPELLYDVHRTADLVAGKLREFGCDDVHMGIGRTGVVGIVRGRHPAGRRSIVIRADMDALPVAEETDRPYSSATPGKMHACGHDGHTSMLLGAAKYLAEARDFAGTAVLVFQPAEEGGKGAEAMIQDGLLERFAVDEVYSLHNMPGIAVGRFAIRPGPIMAASDRFQIRIDGRGGHAARPHEAVDPVVVSAQLVTALQSIVSRNVDPLHSAVITIGAVKTGDTFNVIPPTATLLGTARTLDPLSRSQCEERVRHIAQAVAATFGAEALVEYWHGHPVTDNHADQTSFIAQVAKEVVGADAVDTDVRPFMGSEDFGFMLNERPGAYIFLGNGDSLPLHHPGYDFSDAAIPFGISLWGRLIERRLAPEPA